MSRLFTPNPAVDFGPDQFHSGNHNPPPKAKIQQVTGSRSTKLKSKVRELAPKMPGVYGMLDRNGEIIYVGKAKSLRGRLLGYFRPRSRDAKMGRILSHARAIAWEISHSEFAALHRELELIRRWRPRLNVLGQPNSRQPTYVCLGRKPAPYVFLARRQPRDLLLSFGPIPNSQQAKEAVRRLNDYFLLRDCPQSQEMYFSDQGELFTEERSPGCLRLEIGTCLGPCASGCSSAQYGERVNQVQAFLEGADLSPLQALQKEVNAAARQQLYERAAALRDRMESLRWLYERLNHLRSIQKQGSFIYPICGHDGTTWWYMIHGARVVAALPEPKNDCDRRAASKQIQTLYDQRARSGKNQSPAHRDGILLVTQWFRRYPKERDLGIAPKEALRGLMNSSSTCESRSA